MGRLNILNQDSASGVHRERRAGPARPTFEPSSAGPRPAWLRVRMSAENPDVQALTQLVAQSGLHTVCQSAACPNIGECWAKRALTIMILGNVCTRSCGFCDVQTGRPGAVDEGEPARVAAALATLNLQYAVITSVDRDDLPDGGASMWAATIRAVREACPSMELEVLTPDFKGDRAALELVAAAGPHVLAHNIETVARLHREVRPQARYERSLDVMRWVRAFARAQESSSSASSASGASNVAGSLGDSVTRVVAKSGLMVGMGETDDEVITTLQDLAEAGTQIVSIGQYLRPGPRHLPVRRYVTPEQFANYREAGLAAGLEHVEAGPLVRSSYRADAQAAAYAQRVAG